MYDNTLAAAYVAVRHGLEVSNGLWELTYPAALDQVDRYMKFLSHDQDRFILREVVRLARRTEQTVAAIDPGDVASRERAMQPLRRTARRLHDELSDRLENSEALRTEASDFAGLPQSNDTDLPLHGEAHGLLQAGLTYKSAGMRTEGASMVRTLD